MYMSYVHAKWFYPTLVLPDFLNCLPLNVTFTYTSLNKFKRKKKMPNDKEEKSLTTSQNKIEIKQQKYIQYMLMKQWYASSKHATAKNMSYQHRIFFADTKLRQIFEPKL